MLVKNVVRVMSVVLLAIVVISFQNCGQKLAFASLGRGFGQNDQATSGNTPTPPPAPGSRIGNPEPPVGADETALCVLIQEDAGEDEEDLANGEPAAIEPEHSQFKGVGMRVSHDKKLFFLQTAHKAERAICISINACENIVNAYLNTTDGKFHGHGGQPQNHILQYTRSVLSDGGCRGDTKHKQLTDDQVRGAISNSLSIKND